MAPPGGLGRSEPSPPPPLCILTECLRPYRSPNGAQNKDESLKNQIDAPMTKQRSPLAPREIKSPGPARVVGRPGGSSMSVFCPYQLREVGVGA